MYDINLADEVTGVYENLFWKKFKLFPQNEHSYQIF